MTVSKIRLNGTDHDIRAKYLIQSSSADSVSAEFSARAVTEDAIANIQKIYGNTVVVSDNRVSNSATAILSRGFNQWDEEWEVGTYDDTTGEKAASTSVIRNKNFILCASDTEYCRTFPLTEWFVFYFYDASKSYIGTLSTYGTTSTFTTPANCRYFNWRLRTQYGTVYKHDICVNISDPAKNGTYEPYNGQQIDLNLDSIKVKSHNIWDEVVSVDSASRIVSAHYIKVSANTDYYFRISSGYSATADYFNSEKTKLSTAYNLSNSTFTTPANCEYLKFTVAVGYGSSYNNDICINISDASFNGKYEPYNLYLTGGLKSVGAIYDEIVGNKVIKRVADDNSVLSSPQTYILDNALQLQYPVVAGGTEMVLPTTGTAPMKMDVIYGNAADAAATMSQNFISVDSMKEFLTALGTQMGGTWSMGYENGKHTFTFTST